MALSLGTEFDDPKTQGMLALGLGLLGSRGNLAQSLAQGGQQGLLGYQQARQIAQQRKTQDVQQQMIALQLQQAQQAQAQQAAIQAAQQRRMQTPEQAAMGQMPGGQAGPTMAAAAAAPTAKPGFDLEGFQGDLMGIDYKQGLALRQALTKEQPKVKDQKVARDPKSGQLVNVITFEDGTQKVSAYGAAPDIALQNLGDKLVAVDKNAVGNGNVWQIGASPDARLSAGTTRRGQDMVDARSREGNAINLQNGKIPQGYRMKVDGTLEAIPGGPADIKSGVEGAKAAAKKDTTIAQSNSVLDTISDAKNLVGYTTAGVGSWASILPATDARNLAAKLETVKANLGFDRLQQMRDQSPTGGALGAVAVQELVALQSTVASLDQAQSPAQLEKALTKIEGHYGRWLDTMGAPRKTPKLDTESIYRDADRIINGGR